MSNLKIHRFSGCIPNLLNSWITKLEYRTALCANKVIVLAAFVRFFENGYVFAKLMFNHQAAL